MVLTGLVASIIHLEPIRLGRKSNYQLLVQMIYTRGARSVFTCLIVGAASIKFVLIFCINLRINYIFDLYMLFFMRILRYILVVSIGVL